MNLQSIESINKYYKDEIIEIVEHSSRWSLAIFKNKDNRIDGSSIRCWDLRSLERVPKTLLNTILESGYNYGYWVNPNSYIPKQIAETKIGKLLWG